MLRAVYMTELRRQLGHPLALFVAAFVAFVAFNDTSLTGPTASGLIHIGRVAHNAPLVVAELLTAVIVPGMFLVALMVGPCVQRDFAHRSTPFYFTTPMGKLHYLGGRFFGATTATLLLPCAALMGMAAAWTVIPAEDLGPFRIAGIVPAVAVSLPTLLVFAALYFSIATLSRTMVPTYVASVLTMLAVFVVQGMATELLVRGEVSGTLARWALLLADPTGRAPLSAETLAWSVAERSRRLVPLTVPLLLNRALWTAVAVALLGFTWRRFTIGRPTSGGRTDRAEAADGGGRSVLQSPCLPARLRMRWDLRARIGAFVRLTRIELARTAGHLVFPVLIAGMVVQLISNFVGNVRSAGLVPRTGFLLSEGLGAVDAPVIVLTLFFAGVIVWRERESGEAAIADALPVSNRQQLGSKFATLALLQTIYAGVVIAVALFAQVVLFDYTDVQPSLYVRAVLGIHLLGWIQIAAAMFLVQVLVPSKVWGFSLCSLGVVWAGFAPALGMDSPLLRFGAVPEFIYSEMNGFGPFAGPLIVYRILWTAVAVVCLGVAVVAWPRGRRDRPGVTLRAVAGVVRRPAAWLALPALVATTCIAALAVGRGTPGPAGDADEGDLRAAYELHAKRFDGRPQPTLTRVDVRVDLDPFHRTAEITGAYALENRGDEPVADVLLSLLPTHLREPPRYAFDRPSRPGPADPRAGFATIELDPPLAPGDSTVLSFELHAVGRPPRPSVSPALVDDGTVLTHFLGDASFFPRIGYRSELELRDPEARARHGLPDEPAALRRYDDPKAGLHGSGAWIRFTATVSTDVDQIPITTGAVERSWTDGGRRYVRYVCHAPMVDEFAIVSGRFDVARAATHGIAIELFHDPGHTANVGRMLAGVKAGLDYGIDHFGPYPYRTLRVVEVPGYGIVQGTAVSKPGMVLWNETGGFLDAEAKDGTVDPVFSTAAHESAHQWWAHQVRPASGVDGALALNETLAQYVRLMTLRRRYDETAVQAFLDDERRTYLVLRGRSAVEEHPLVSTSENFVAYHKGTLAMAAVVDAVGETAMNDALRSLVRRYALAGPPYPTTLNLLEALRSVTPPSRSELLHDWLETITFEQARVVSATAGPLSGGRTVVRVVAELRKFRMDGRGERRPVPFCGEVELGVYDISGRLLQLSPLPVDATMTTLEVEVDGTPASVMLDPSERLLEIDRDDNLRAITNRVASAGD